MQSPLYNLLLDDSTTSYTCKNTSFFHVQFELLSGSARISGYSIQAGGDNLQFAPSEWKVFVSSSLARGITDTEGMEFQLVHQIEKGKVSFKKQWQKLIFRLP